MTTMVDSTKYERAFNTLAAKARVGEALLAKLEEVYAADERDLAVDVDAIIKATKAAFCRIEKGDLR